MSLPEPVWPVRERKTLAAITQDYSKKRLDVQMMEAAFDVVPASQGHVGGCVQGHPSEGYGNKRLP